jgi:hypothetical protein
MSSAKEVCMATVKQDKLKSSLSQNSFETASDTEMATEPADFELDELLRTLRVNEWFAMAEEGMPLWVC